MSRRQALYTMRSQPYLTPQLQHPAPLLSHQKYLHHSQGDRDVPRRYQGQLRHQTTTVTFVWEMCTRTRKLDSLRSCCLVLTVEDQVDVTLWCHTCSFHFCVKTARKMAQVWLLFHFSRGQNRESRSSVFLCSETKRKRLLRRLLSARIKAKVKE